MFTLKCTLKRVVDFAIWVSVDVYTVQQRMVNGSMKIPGFVCLVPQVFI